jgi:outer membrane protein assembly factor BamA
MKASLFFLVLAIPAIFGCTGLQNVTREDPLFIGNEYELIGGTSKDNRAINRADINLQPEPNSSFLWMRPALARYNMLSDSARNKKFWKRKVSEPVRISQVKPDQISRALNNRVYHRGYFHNQVTYDTIRVGNRKAKYLYTIEMNQGYRLGTIEFPGGDNHLSASIRESSENTLLQTGMIYSLETIIEERKRIDQYLKEHGYLYFNPEFIYVEADSVSEDFMVNLSLKVKPNIPPESRTSYTIDKIYTLDDYALVDYAPDTTNLDPYYFLSMKHDLQPKAIRRGIHLAPGESYSQSEQSRTLRYLNRLPIIQSASLRFVPGDEEDQLNAMIYLTKRKQFAYTAEFNTIFRSTNYFGPGAIFSFTNRNTGGRAEQLKVNLRGRYEIQIADGEVNPAYELGLELNYQIPTLRPRLGFLRRGSMNPQTVISTGYNLFNRLDLYRLNSIFLDFGYRWSKNEILSHRLDPFSIIFTQIPESSKSDAFKDYLEQNPGVRRSFEEQFVLGMGYELTYDPKPAGKSDFYLRTGIDFAGNLLYGAYEIFNAEKDSAGQYKLFGVPFSQYFRTRLDFRYAYSFSPNNRLVTRIVSGVGYPFANSEVLPYIKQFYIGGTNSLRSFIARTVGPGSEVPPEGFRDLTGDILLEWNLEYRFTIAGNLKSALFVDAGNVWLFNEDPDRPNGAFRFDTFLDEIAVSSGVGFRWDFDFVIARLDLAYTLRTPYLPEGERWNKDINIWKPTWNIAIGYPF